MSGGHFAGNGLAVEFHQILLYFGCRQGLPEGATTRGRPGSPGMRLVTFEIKAEGFV